LLLSQEREGSSRGPNLDRKIVDEALTLNWIIYIVEDCYYPLDSQLHIYYDACNDDFIRGLAENSN
jgi:hypothetical protein